MKSNATSVKPAAGGNLILPWVFVGIPFAWGVFNTVGNAAALFK